MLTTEEGSAIAADGCWAAFMWCGRSTNDMATEWPPDSVGTQDWSAAEHV